MLFSTAMPVVDNDDHHQSGAYILERPTRIPTTEGKPHGAGITAFALALGIRGVLHLGQQNLDGCYAWICAARWVTDRRQPRLLRQRVKSRIPALQEANRDDRPSSLSEVSTASGAGSVVQPCAR